MATSSGTAPARRYCSFLARLPTTWFFISRTALSRAL